MSRVEASPSAAIRFRSSQQLWSIPMKIAVGAMFIAFLALVMPPYLIGLAIYVAAAAACRTVAIAGVAIYQAVIDAGESILGA